MSRFRTMGAVALTAAALVASPALAKKVKSGTKSTTTAKSGASAWSVAKNMIPSGMLVVGGANVATLQKSPKFNEIIGDLVQGEPSVNEGFKLVKSTCGVDPLAIIHDAVVAVDDAGNGGFYLSLNGLDSDGVTTCLKKLAATDNEKLNVTKDGNIVGYTVGTQTIYMAWPSSNVVVLASHPEDESMLKEMLGGNGVGKDSGFARGLGAVKTDAALWAVIVGKPSQSGPQLKSIYGSADYAAGFISGEVHTQLATAKDAKDFRNTADLMIRDNGQNFPPELQPVLKSLKVDVSGDEVVFKSSISEDQAVDLAQMIAR